MHRFYTKLKELACTQFVGCNLIFDHAVYYFKENKMPPNQALPAKKQRDFANNAQQAS